MTEQQSFLIWVSQNNFKKIRTRLWQTLVVAWVGSLVKWSLEENETSKWIFLVLDVCFTTFCHVVNILLQLKEISKQLWQTFYKEDTHWRKSNQIQKQLSWLNEWLLMIIF